MSVELRLYRRLGNILEHAAQALGQIDAGGAGARSPAWS